VKKVQILGPGCPKCTKLHETVVKIVDTNGLSCEIEKVADITQIVTMGVMMTPALVIDGEVKTSGKIPGDDEILAWLRS